MNAETRHTPEPWSADKWALGFSVSSDPGHCTVCRLEGCNNEEADAARIVACVNLFAGMADPAAEIARLRECEKALLLCVARLEEYGDAEGGTALELARSALGKQVQS